MAAIPAVSTSWRYLGVGAGEVVTSVVEDTRIPKEVL